MRARTEEFLYMVLWTCDTLLHPTFRNLTDSFEAWAYRSGFLRQLQRLEQQQWLERQHTTKGNRLYRLTETGRRQALGGRCPDTCWQRPWDGRWRLVVFDVPEIENRARDKLRYYLQNHGFGCLQKSVWITPDPVHEQHTVLEGGLVNVESLTFFEAVPCAGESNAQIVAGAWDFATINHLYDRHGQVLKRRPHQRIDSEAVAMAFRQWLREEQQAWRAVMRCDPLLPQVLLPNGYAGRKAWLRRKEIMAEAGDQMRGFHPA